MGEYLSKKAVLEWFGLMHLEYSHNAAVSEFIESGIEIFESGAFDTKDDLDEIIRKNHSLAVKMKVRTLELEDEIQRLRAALEDIRYQVQQSDHPAGLGILATINQALSTTTEPADVMKAELLKGREPNHE